MDSEIKVNCTPAQIQQVFDNNLLNILFFCFDIQENGFDPAILTPEQWEEEQNTPYVYSVRVRTCDFKTTLKKRYSSLGMLLSAISKRNTRYLREVVKKRKGDKL